MHQKLRLSWRMLFGVSLWVSGCGSSSLPPLDGAVLPDSGPSDLADRGSDRSPNSDATADHPVTDAAPATALLTVPGPVWAMDRYDDKSVAVLLSDRVLLVNLEDQSQLPVASISGDRVLANYTDHPELIVADLLSGSSGPEILFKDSQHVLLARRTASGWTTEDLGFCDWSIAVGDVDPSPGNEVVCGAEGDLLDTGTLWIFRRQQGSWESHAVFTAEVPMKVEVSDFDPALPGSEVIFATEMGETYLLRPAAAGGSAQWTSELVWDNFEQAAWSLKHREVDSAHPGLELVYATRYADSILLGLGARATPEVIFTGQKADPQNPNMLAIETVQRPDGARIVGADYSGSIYLLSKGSGGWKGSTFYQAGEPVYSLLAVAGPGGQQRVIAGTQSGKLLQLGF